MNNTEESLKLEEDCAVVDVVEMELSSEAYLNCCDIVQFD